MLIWNLEFLDTLEYSLEFTGESFGVAGVKGDD
jgi:hypothetical protein